MKRTSEFIAQSVLDDDGRVVGTDKIARLYRCKDCRFWMRSSTGDRGKCKYHGDRKNSLQFCSEGQPRG